METLVLAEGDAGGEVDVAVDVDEVDGEFALVADLVVAGQADGVAGEGCAVLGGQRGTWMRTERVEARVDLSLLFLVKPSLATFPSYSSGSRKVKCEMESSLARKLIFTVSVG